MRWSCGTTLASTFLGCVFPYLDLGKQFIPRTVVGRQLLEGVALEERAGIQVHPARFLFQQAASQLDAARPLLFLHEMLDLVARARRHHEVEPVAARLVAGIGDDLDDVAVAQAGAQRHHLAVDAGADALVADVGVNGVREIDRRRAPRERLHLPFGREDVDLFRIQIDFEVLNELVRVADFLLHFQQLADPLEVALVAMVADAAFLVFPVRRDAFLGVAMHLVGANLHLERHPALADDRRVQRLIAVGPRHGDEVLDAAGHGRPRLMDDAERRVAVLDAVGDDPERHEVVHLIQLDPLALELLVDAVEPLQPAVHVQHRHLRFAQLGRNGLLQIFDLHLDGLAAALDLRAERLVAVRIEILERQLLELVLDLAHAQPVGDGRVDVQRLLRRPQLPIFRHVLERPHVVQAVGQLHENDADVVDHRQQHLAEVLGLALLARRKVMALILVTPSTTCATSGPKCSWIFSMVVRVSSTTS